MAATATTSVANSCVVEDHRRKGSRAPRKCPRGILNYRVGVTAKPSTRGDTHPLVTEIGQSKEAVIAEGHELDLMHWLTWGSAGLVASTAVSCAGGVTVCLAHGRATRSHVAGCPGRVTRSRGSSINYRNIPAIHLGPQLPPPFADIQPTVFSTAPTGVPGPGNGQKLAVVCAWDPVVKPGWGAFSKAHALVELLFQGTSPASSAW